MDDTTPRCCPGCHRLAAPEARVCRACYTVIPKDEPQKDAEPFRTRPKLLTGLKYVGLLIVAAWATWFFQVDTGTEDTAGGKNPLMMANARAHVSQLINETLGTKSTPSSKIQITRNGRRASQQVISRSGQCDIRQGVRNHGDELVSDVVFDIALLDMSGNSIGEDVSVTTVVDIPVRSSRAVALRVPCPFAVASVEVSLPPEGAGNPPQTVVLVESIAAWNVSRPTTAHASQVALQVPEPTLCPLSDECELQVALSSGGSSTFSFHRDPAQPVMLLSDDSLLIGHLLTDGTATIKVEMDEGVQEIQLTNRELREKEPRSVLAKWIQRIL